MSSLEKHDVEKLNAGHYARVRPLFAELRYNLVIDSIIEGHTPAWVYVDRRSAPRQALLWNRQDALLLAGSHDNGTFNREVGGLFTGNILPDARARYIPQLALFYDPAGWEEKVNTLLRGQPAARARRRYYQPGPTGDPAPGAIPAGYRLCRIDEELLRQEDVRNMAHVTGWIHSFWPGIAEFVEQGFGFCLLEGDRTVASWCLTVYKSAADYELGVATAPAYRQQGFATLVAAACVEHARARDFTLHWHCWEDNAPSIAVADRVGFEEAIPYTVYRIPVPSATGMGAA